MAFELPALPYAKDALAPHISEETFDYHYGKHHQAYVTNLNNLVKDTENEDKSLEDIILSSSGGLFNNSAQVWNHTFYWNCMSPTGGGLPSGALAEALAANFGSVEKFVEDFAAAAKGNFGSGWTWLVKDGDKLAITSTSNADLPMKHGQTALLTIDVWEHAYYVDYRNARPSYVDTFLAHLVNWDFVAANLG
jgi:Fe-Mn family superoxide dismutase